MDNYLVLIFPFILSCIFIAVGFWYIWKILKSEYVDNRILEVSELIFEGIEYFFNRVIQAVAQGIVLISVSLFIFSLIFNKPFPVFQIITFAVGAVAMSGCIFIGIKIVPLLIPKAILKSKYDVTGAIKMLFHSAGAIGFLIFAILILSFLVCVRFLGINSVIGFGLGVMLTSFFYRVGGGVYKTSADIGSCIVSKIEKKVPEFDARNVSTILALTGNYIEEIFGFGSDILSSFVIVIISIVIFSYSLVGSKFVNVKMLDKLYALPFLFISMIMITTLITFFYVLLRLKKRPNRCLIESFLLTIFLSAGFGFFIFKYLDISIIFIILNKTISFWGTKGSFSLFIPFFMGLLGSVFYILISWYVSYRKFKPVKSIAREAEYGTVVCLFNGLSSGLRTSGLFFLILIIILITAFTYAGFFGIAMGALGMLSITGTALILKIYAPIAANTSKIANLTISDSIILTQTRKIERMGESTWFLENGYATGVAVVSTLSMLFSFLLMTNKKESLVSMLVIDMQLFLGIILGILLFLIFSGFLLKGLNKTILALIFEVKRQFRDIPYLMENKARPDVKKASDYLAINAMNALTLAIIFIILVPLLIGYYMGFEGVKFLFGMLLGLFFTGVNQGFYWAIFGNSLKSAKIHIENGHFGGDKSPTYDNILVADNFGDAFKDLLSPSINIMLKVVGILSILIVYILLI